MEINRDASLQWHFCGCNYILSLLRETRFSRKRTQKEGEIICVIGTALLSLHVRACAAFNFAGKWKVSSQMQQQQQQMQLASSWLKWMTSLRTLFRSLTFKFLPTYISYITASLACCFSSNGFRALYKLSLFSDQISIPSRSMKIYICKFLFFCIYLSPFRKLAFLYIYPGKNFYI